MVSQARTAADQKAAHIKAAENFRYAHEALGNAFFRLRRMGLSQDDDYLTETQQAHEIVGTMLAALDGDYAHIVAGAKPGDLKKMMRYEIPWPEGPLAILQEEREAEQAEKEATDGQDK